MIEKESQIGGTWFHQKFHGVRFDSLHTQTLYSFAPMLCAPMCEAKVFLDYLIKVAKDNGIYPNINFSESVENVNFDTKTKMWTVTTSKDTYVVNYVMNANGYYDHVNPNVPDQFKGPKNKFKGELIHSMHVDQNRDDWTGQDVVLVGSGATSATMIPEIAKVAKSVTMLQRSNSYVLQGDWPYPGYITAVKLHKRGIEWPWKVYRIVMNLAFHSAVMMGVHYIPSMLFICCGTCFFIPSSPNIHCVFYLYPCLSSH